MNSIRLHKKVPLPISTSNSWEIISAIANTFLPTSVETLGQDMQELVINRSSIYHCRERLHKERAGVLKNKFKELKLQAGVTHWNRKILSEMTDKIC